jgi:large subunit ribosomal protein L20
MAIWSKHKFFTLSKGYWGRSKNCWRIAIRRVFKALQYAYRDRRVRRREMKKGWIRTINAGVREHDVNYSRFIYGLNRSNVILDRKILADLVQNEPYSFKAIVDEVKSQVKLSPLTRAPLSYDQAIEQNLLQHGPYQFTKQKDKDLRYATLKDKNQPDWFLFNHEDFPKVYKDILREDRKKTMSVKEMKKIPFSAYDELPSDPDDDF